MGIKTTVKSRHVAEARARYRTAPRAPAHANLASALFTATQQRVLGLLFGQSGRSFFATELISLAGAGSGGVQREIRRLVDSGLVTVTRIGNQKHYQANRAAPVYRELRDIVVKTLGPAGVLRAALAPLAAQIHSALLYGSVAKGSDSATSDIDVLIVADGLTLEAVYAALAPAEKRLGRRISPTLYTRKEFQRRHAAGNPFVSKVLGGKHVLLIGNRDAAA
jgi:predicted nucleotidyltransferase